jgi:hypothetical protein
MKTLKQLITESVNEYLREIEEAGNENAVIEKMKSCEEAIAVRERKIKMDGIEEAMHDMIDPKKIKELQKEVKVIEKTLKKYQKQLEKLKSKNKHVGAEDTEDSTEEPEEIIDEGMEDDMNEYGLEHDPNQIGDKDKDGDIDVEDSLVNEVLTPEEEKELIEIEEYIRYEGNSQGAGPGNKKIGERYEELKAKQNQMPAPPEELNIDINESFLYMQKLAGLITEGQYQAKKKVLNRKKSIAEGMDENLVVTYIKNKADYPEKGLADGFHEYEGKTVKYIVGYDENDEYDEIGYIYAKNNDIKSYSDDELDNAFMISLAEGQYQAKKKALNRKKSIAEGVDENFEALMDAVDEYYEPNTPKHKKLSNAVEKALNNGDIDTMDFSDSPSSPYNTVARIAKKMEETDISKQNISSEKAVEKAISLAPKLEKSSELDTLAQKVANDPKLIAQMEKALQKGGINLNENEDNLSIQDMKTIALNFAKKGEQMLQESEEVDWDDAAAGAYMASFIGGGVAVGLSSALYTTLLSIFPFTLFLVGGPAIIGAIAGVALVALARKVYTMTN